MTYARHRDPELAGWIEREVRFPNAMVDRITPQTTDADRRDVTERYGVQDGWPVVCSPTPGGSGLLRLPLRLPAR